MNNEVKDGYNKIAQQYTDDRDQFKSEKYLQQFTELLGENKTILDIGCGAGKPIDQFLIKHGQKVIGLDISEAQIALAKKNVPEAEFQVFDMSDLQPEQFQVDGAVSFYAIFHTPREKHQQLLSTINSFLPKDGLLLITMGASEWEGSEEFHGAEMHWSHFGAEKNHQLLENAGFSVILDQIDTSGDEKHQILLGRKK